MTVKISLNQLRELARNQVVTNDVTTLPFPALSRTDLINLMADPRKNINKECGYPETVGLPPDFYRDLYDTDPIACRVCQLMPEECWQAPPTVYEDEDSTNVTDFEEAWDNLARDFSTSGQSYYKTEEGSPIWEYLKRADILSGIGQFGVILLGINDGRNLQDPVDGIEPITSNVVINGLHTTTILHDAPPHRDEIANIQSLYGNDENWQDALATNCLYNPALETMVRSNIGDVVINRRTSKLSTEGQAAIHNRYVLNTYHSPYHAINNGLDAHLDDPLQLNDNPEGCNQYTGAGCGGGKEKVAETVGFIKGARAGKRVSKQAVSETIKQLMNLSPSEMLAVANHLGSHDDAKLAAATKIAELLLGKGGSSKPKTTPAKESQSKTTEDDVATLLKRPLSEREDNIREVERLSGKPFAWQIMQHSGISPKDWASALHNFGTADENRHAIHSGLNSVNKEHARLGAALHIDELWGMVHEGRISLRSKAGTIGELHQSGFLSNTLGTKIDWTLLYLETAILIVKNAASSGGLTDKEHSALVRLSHLVSTESAHLNDTLNYDPDQERDEAGRFSAAAHSATEKAIALSKEAGGDSEYGHQFGLDLSKQAVFHSDREDPTGAIEHHSNAIEHHTMKAEEAKEQSKDYKKHADPAEVGLQAAREFKFSSDQHKELAKAHLTAAKAHKKAIEAHALSVNYFSSEDDFAAIPTLNGGPGSGPRKKQAGFELVPGVQGVKKSPDHEFTGSYHVTLDNGDTHEVYHDRQSGLWIHASPKAKSYGSGHLATQRGDVLPRLVDRQNDFHPTEKTDNELTTNQPSNGNGKPVDRSSSPGPTTQPGFGSKSAPPGNATGTSSGVQPAQANSPATPSQTSYRPDQGKANQPASAQNPANPLAQAQQVSSGAPGDGPFIQGTDSQYSSGFGLGMPPPNPWYGPNLSGTDQQYFGVQFGPSEQFDPDIKPTEHKLLFMRVFSEDLVQVVRYEWNIRNPRFGLPVMYRITLNDPRQPHSGVGLPLATVYVHWSRIIHLADNLHSSEIFGVPRMRPVLPPILDVRKIAGASGEGYWQSCIPTTVLSTHPQLGGDVVVDRPSIQQMMDDVRNGLSRNISLMGMGASQLSPSIVDPTPHIEIHLGLICMKLGCPVRVFKGSERGELASSQDDEAWNERKHSRQVNYLTPKVIIPFVDRLIQLGVLPKPNFKKQVGQAEHKDGPIVDRTGGSTPEDRQNDAADLQSKNPAIGAQLQGANGNGIPKNGNGGSKGSTPNSSSSPNGAVSLPNRKSGPPATNHYKDSTRNRGYRLIRNENGQVVGAESPMGYTIEWPDLDALGDKDKAAIALSNTQALVAYVGAQGQPKDIISPHDFLSREQFMNMGDEVADEIIDSAESHAQDEHDNNQDLADEQGHEPAPPPGFQKAPPPMPPGLGALLGGGAGGPPKAGGPPGAGGKGPPIKGATIAPLTTKAPAAPPAPGK